MPSDNKQQRKVNALLASFGDKFLQPDLRIGEWITILTAMLAAMIEVASAHKEDADTIAQKLTDFIAQWQERSH